MQRRSKFQPLYLLSCPAAMTVVDALVHARGGTEVSMDTIDSSIVRCVMFCLCQLCEY